MDNRAWADLLTLTDELKDLCESNLDALGFRGYEFTSDELYNLVMDEVNEIGERQKVNVSELYSILRRYRFGVDDILTLLNTRNDRDLLIDDTKELVDSIQVAMNNQPTFIDNDIWCCLIKKDVSWKSEYRDFLHNTKNKYRIFNTSLLFTAICASIKMYIEPFQLGNEPAIDVLQRLFRVYRKINNTAFVAFNKYALDFMMNNHYNEYLFGVDPYTSFKELNTVLMQIGRDNHVLVNGCIKTLCNYARLADSKTDLDKDQFCEFYDNLTKTGRASSMWFPITGDTKARIWAPEAVGLIDFPDYIIVSDTNQLYIADYDEIKKPQQIMEEVQDILDRDQTAIAFVHQMYYDYPQFWNKTDEDFAKFVKEGFKRYKLMREISKRGPDIRNM